jgi:hypothetical protein
MSPRRPRWAPPALPPSWALTSRACASLALSSPRPTLWPVADQGQWPSGSGGTRSASVLGAADRRRRACRGGDDGEQWQSVAAVAGRRGRSREELETRAGDEVPDGARDDTSPPSAAAARRRAASTAAPARPPGRTSHSPVWSPERADMPNTQPLQVVNDPDRARGCARRSPIDDAPRDWWPAWGTTSHAGCGPSYPLTPGLKGSRPGTRGPRRAPGAGHPGQPAPRSARSSAGP